MTALDYCVISRRILPKCMKESMDALVRSRATAPGVVLRVCSYHEVYTTCMVQEAPTSILDSCSYHTCIRQSIKRTTIIITLILCSAHTTGRS